MSLVWKWTTRTFPREHSHFLAEDKCSAYMQTLQTDGFLGFTHDNIKITPPLVIALWKWSVPSLQSTFFKQWTFSQILYCAYFNVRRENNANILASSIGTSCFTWLSPFWTWPPTLQKKMKNNIREAVRQVTVISQEGVSHCTPQIFLQALNPPLEQQDRNLPLFLRFSPPENLTACIQHSIPAGTLWLAPPLSFKAPQALRLLSKNHYRGLWRHSNRFAKTSWWRWAPYIRTNYNYHIQQPVCTLAEIRLLQCP